MKKIYLLLLLFLISFCGFAQSRYISATTKKVVFTRDGGVCQCCGSSNSLEYDHITPFSCGGISDVSNIQLLCMSCNRSKSNSCICKIHNNCCLLKFKQNLFVKFIVIVVCFKNKLFVKFVLIVAGLFSLRKILYRK